MRSETFMKILLTLLTGTLALMALGGCTARDEQLVKDLENMPGVTCTNAGTDGQMHCGPDSLKATQTP
jgi:hypothetical protein